MLQGIENCRAIYFASKSSRDSCPEAAAFQGLSPVTRLLLCASGIQRALCQCCALGTLSCVGLGAQSPGPDVWRYLVLGATGWENYTPLLARGFWNWTPCSWIKSNAILCNISFQRLELGSALCTHNGCSGFSRSQHALAKIPCWKQHSAHSSEDSLWWYVPRWRQPVLRDRGISGEVILACGF